MSSTTLAAVSSATLGPFALLVGGLMAKLLFLAGIQGVRRHRTRLFRWPEDARHWRGQVSTDATAEDPLAVRAQAALRNDGESQPLFLAVGALWLAAGARGALAYLVVVGYLALRTAHTCLLLWPRQPARNRVFALALLLMLGVLGDAVRRLGQ